MDDLMVLAMLISLLVFCITIVVLAIFARPKVAMQAIKVVSNATSGIFGRGYFSSGSTPEEKMEKTCNNDDEQSDNVV